MRIERHVFGSFTGYTTLARSPGVGPEEARQLETPAFGFGQTSDRGYLKSLDRNPAWFTRALRGGKRGLTRVLEGAGDDNGRPTLLMITLIIPQRDWDGELCGDVDSLLNDASCWKWNGQGDLPAIDRPPALVGEQIPRRSVPKILALLSEIERQFPLRRAITVSLDEYGSDELRALEILMPPVSRGQFSCGCRSLGESLSVSVNAIAPESGSQNYSFRYQAAAPLSAYARFLQTTSLPSGVVPLAEVMGYRTFGRRETATIEAAPVAFEPQLAARQPVYAPPAPAPARGSRVLVPVLITLCLVLAGLGFIAGLKLGGRQIAALPAPQAPSIIAAPSTSQPAALPLPTPPATPPGDPPAIVSHDPPPASAPPVASQDPGPGSTPNPANSPPPAGPNPALPVSPQPVSPTPSPNPDGSSPPKVPADGAPLSDVQKLLKNAGVSPKGTAPGQPVNSPSGTSPDPVAPAARPPAATAPAAPAPAADRSHDDHHKSVEQQLKASHRFAEALLDKSTPNQRWIAPLQRDVFERFASAIASLADGLKAAKEYPKNADAEYLTHNQDALNAIVELAETVARLRRTEWAMDAARLPIDPAKAPKTSSKSGTITTDSLQKLDEDLNNALQELAKFDSAPSPFPSVTNTEFQTWFSYWNKHFSQRLTEFRAWAKNREPH